MKKIISVITVIAVMLTMLVMPANADVSATIYAGYNLGTENGGLYGKTADEYAVIMTTPASDAKAPLKISGKNYKFTDSKYAVLDLNVAPLDGATYISAGADAAIYAVDQVKAFNRNQWNSIRVVVENTSADTMTASGKYQPTTLYVIGVKIETNAAALNTGDKLHPGGTGTNVYGNGFRFTVHGPVSTDVAYVADARISESDVNEAPVMPVLDTSDKYTVYNRGIIINEGATVGDLTAGSNSVAVYNGDTLIEDESAALAEGYTIIVTDSVNKLYKYYNVGTAPEVKEWKDYKPKRDAEGNVIDANGNIIIDKNGKVINSSLTKVYEEEANTYTWSFSPYTQVLTIGMLDKPTVSANTTYGAIDVEPWANGTTAGSSNRPWHSVRDQIKEIKFEENSKNHWLCLGREMFAGFNGLESVVIPRYVVDAQWGTFGYCTNLHTVTFEEGSHGMEGGYTTLFGMKMFQGCTNLRNVELGTGMTHLNVGQMFYNCKSLKELFVPAHVDTVSTSLFDGCGDVKITTYENSTAAAKIAATTFKTSSTSVTLNVTKEYIAAEGYIPDSQGNENSISWKIDADTQTLIISDVAEVGTGDMPDKAGDNYQGRFPWNAISGYNKVVVEDGITRIGRWFLQSPKPGDLESISIPGSVKEGKEFAFVSVVATDLIFHEGATGIFSAGELINRDVKIENVYLPASACDIKANLWRGLDESDGNVYLGLSEVNIYAPLGSDAYKWSVARAANPAKDSGTEKGNDVVIAAIANIEAKSFDDENVVITNHGFADETTDVIVAYFDGTVFKDVVIAQDVVLAADSDTNVSAPVSADGYKREVFVWNDIAKLVPVAINVGE